LNAFYSLVEPVQIGFKTKYREEKNMNAVVITYLLYLAISLALTVWVARTLHRNGQIFLVDVFHGNAALGSSVNHLLVVGFYLVNLGFVSLALKLGYEVENSRQSIEALSSKVGLVLLVLGGMHFFNLFIFNRLRNRSRLPYLRPPVEPDSCTAARGA